MERLKMGRKGITLIELLISISLLSVIMLTASTLLVSFKKFYFDFVQKQGDIEEVSLAALEEIVNRVYGADAAVVIAPGNTIEVYVDNGNPESVDDDICHAYWKDGAELKYHSRAGAGAWGPDRVMVEEITKFNCTGLQQVTASRDVIKIEIGIQTSGGIAQEFQTIVSTR